MIPEIAHLFLIFALLLTVLQCVVPLAGSYLRLPLWMHLGNWFASFQFFCLVISFVLLSYSFLINDFSVVYVASHSNTQLPWFYKISAVWSAHEGSMLLWVLILSAWTVAVLLGSRQLPLQLKARIMAILGFLSTAFLLFILETSNPFLRYLPEFPQEGADLNPLLQDPGLVIHPPMLYLGYVGFSVPFAFALASILTGRLDTAWARWTRPWVTASWIFLTLGITLGSWWAYYELGWGGWWFWDPVENASIMPWFAGTALMHSLVATEKRNLFKQWTLLLAILTYSLSLLGTFLVRSGILTSVHAFANDPERGIYILSLLGLVIGGSLFIYAWKLNKFDRDSLQASPVSYQLLSKETFLLINNILLFVMVLTVLLGTLYPLIFELLNLGKISVGPPWFNVFVVPIMLALGFFMSLGPVINWKKHAKLWLSWLSRIALLCAVFLFLLMLLKISRVLNPEKIAIIYAIMTLLLVPWTIFFIGFSIWRRVRFSANKFTALKNLPLHFYGMHCAHLGLLITFIGVCIVSLFSVERDVRLTVGDAAKIGEYEFLLKDVVSIKGPNYLAQQAMLDVKKGQHHITTLHPQKRFYPARQSTMTETDIDPSLIRDLYASMGEMIDKKTWTMRLHYKPFVRWIWLGGIIMAFGGLLAIMDKRYRLSKKIEG